MLIVNYCHCREGGDAWPDDYQEFALLNFYHFYQGCVKAPALRTSTSITLYMALCLVSEGKIPRNELRLLANGWPIEVSEDLKWVWPKESGMPDPIDFQLRCMRAVVQYFKYDRRNE